MRNVCLVIIDGGPYKALSSYWCNFSSPDTNYMTLQVRTTRLRFPNWTRFSPSYSLFTWPRPRKLMGFGTLRM